MFFHRTRFGASGETLALLYRLKEGDCPKFVRENISMRLRFSKDLQLELEGGQGLPARRAESEGIELDYRGWTPSCL